MRDDGSLCCAYLPFYARLFCIFGSTARRSEGRGRQMRRRMYANASPVSCLKRKEESQLRKHKRGQHTSLSLCIDGKASVKMTILTEAFALSHGEYSSAAGGKRGPKRSGTGPCSYFFNK